MPGYLIKILNSTAAVLLPIFILPLLMRFFVSFIVLSRVKKRYLPGYLENISSGWTRTRDKEAIEKIKQKVLVKLKYHLAFQFNFSADIKEVLAEIETLHGKKEKNEKLNYSFSLKRAAYCFLLAFCDIYAEYAGSRWFGIIKNLKIKWFFRINSIKDLYTKFKKIPLIETLLRTRVLWKVLRVILIPLLGAPHAIFYFIRSMTISVFYESFLRFLYALLLMKVGYYALFLYGKGNRYLEDRIKRIPQKRLDEIYTKIKVAIDPGKDNEKSACFAAAADRYNKLMESWGLEPDGKTVTVEKTFLEKTGSFFTRIFESSKKAYKRTLPMAKPEVIDEKKRLLMLFKEIGSCYYPKKDPLKELRIHEALEVGYMAAITVIHKILSTPGVNLLADKITVNMLIKVKDLATRDFTKALTKNVKEGYKYYRLVSIASRVFHLARKAATPYGLIFSLGSPVLFDQLKDLTREYVFHRAGRLIIYGFETNIRKKKTVLYPLLW